MSKIFKKENIKPVAVLVIISLVVALLLGAINLITAPEIARRKQAAVDAAFKDVLPEGKNFEPVDLTSDYPKEVKAVYKADGGYVFQLDTRGKEAMTLMVGVDGDGKVAGVKVITESETPGYKENAFAEVTGANGKYIGKSADDLEKIIVSGATLTSNGVYSAVKAALDGFTVASGGEVAEEQLPTSDEDIIASAAALLGVDGATLVNMTPEDNELTYVKRIYRSADKKNYAVYTLVISQYGTPETITVTHIGTDGKVKGIDRLLFKSSDAADYGNGVKYDPPTEDQVNAFYDRLVGANEGTIDSVEVISGTTTTSNALKAAIKEAITAVTEIVRADMPTPEEEVIARAETLLGVAAGTLTDVTPEGEFENLKRIYRSADRRSYAVYTVVISQYGTPETETILHIGTDGTVKGIDKMIFKSSDAADYGNGVKYDPPTADQVNAFYDRLISASTDNIDSVAVITGTTTTSNALKSAIKEALGAVKTLVWKDTPTEESLIIAGAAELLGSKVDALTDISPEGASFLKRLYRDDKLGYAAYVVVISERYNRVESEALLHIGFDGKIKAAKKMTWKTSDAVDYGTVKYDPPSQEAADAFFGRLVGASLEGIDAVEPVTNATTTTDGLKGAIKEALTVIGGLDFKPAKTTLFRVLAISIMALAALGFVAYLVVPKIIDRRKNR